MEISIFVVCHGSNGCPSPVISLCRYLRCSTLMKSKSSYLNSHWEGHNGRKPMFDNPSAYASRSYVARKRTSSPIEPWTYLPRVTIPIYQYLHLPLLMYVPSKADVILPETMNIVEVVDRINHALSPVYAPHHPLMNPGESGFPVEKTCTSTRSGSKKRNMSWERYRTALELKLHATNQP